MARQNVSLLSFNRGVISPKAIARVDLDRTRLSAETFNNWLAKTQGALTIRPGTKYCGSSINDTGAEFIEFVAATDDVALCELTHNKMRLWLGTDAHSLTLLGRPAVDTTLTLSDTGWSNTSTGGAIATPATDVIPTMTGYTTNGVTISASSELADGGMGLPAWLVGDNDNSTFWQDTGFGKSALPTWLNVDFGSGNSKAVSSYSIRATSQSYLTDNAPSAWRLITANYDTGTYATDTGKWILVDERSGQTSWAASEKRSFERADADTGTVESLRHWRL